MKNRKRNGQRLTGGTRTKTGGRMMLGIFVGLVLGLALAAGVAYYLGRAGLASPLPSLVGSKDGNRAVKADAAGNASTVEKPRFDFYKILPGAEEPKVAAAAKGPGKVVERLDDPGASGADKTVSGAAVPGKPVDRLWLQAGAFASESDAENLKARLAMSGWEAAVQAATVPDQGVRYRVRLGPYDNTDELNRIKTDLGKNGFDVAVIKNP